LICQHYARRDFSKKVNEFLSDDGKIELRYNAEGEIVNEPAIIADLQNQIAEITEKVANAEQDAQLDLLNLKFGGGKLSLESYDSFITELQNTVNSRMSASDEAFIKVAAGLKLQYESGSLPFSEYEKQYQDAIDSYGITVSGVRAKLENFGFDIIGENYADVLGPDAKQKFSSAISNSLKEGIKLEDWTSADVEKFLGVSGLDEEVANGIGKMLSGVNNLLDPLKVNPEFQVEPGIDLESEILNATSLQKLEADAKVSVNPEWEVQNVGDPGSEIMALVSPDGQYAVPFDVLAEVGWTISGDKFNPELLSPDGTQRVPISAEAAVNWTAVTGLDFDTSQFTQTIPGVAEPVTVTRPVKTEYTVAEGSGFDASKITSQVPPSVGPANTQVNVTSSFTPANKFKFKQADFGIDKTYPADIAINITARFHPANSFTFNKSAFGIASSYQASTNVSIKVNYSVDKSGMPNISSIKKARGGIVGPNGPMGFAEGGMVRGGPQLVTVAEEGTPEMIIPLGSQRRQRGMQLWRKAGHMLGVEGFANGGIAGRFGRMAEPSDFVPNVINFPDPETFQSRKIRQDKPEPEPLPRRKSDNSNSSSANVSVNVGDINVTLNINVSSANEDEIMALVEKKSDEITNVIVGKINRALSDSLANTPALGGETA